MATDSLQGACLRALGTLIDEGHRAAADGLPDIVNRAWTQLGFGAVMHLVDYEQRDLHAWLPSGTPPRSPLPINATLAGRVFRFGQSAMSAAGDAPAMLLPLNDGVERLGVLELTAYDGVDLEDLEVRRQLRRLALLTGHLAKLKGQSGDALHVVRRTRARTVAAELVWQLLPALSFGTERFLVAGLVEPAYEVGGDVFCYAVDGDIAHLAIFDSMGHGLGAGMMAAAVVAAYRSCRRERRDLLDTAMVLDEIIEAQFGGASFATGVIGQLNLDSGLLRYVAAGHPYPLVLRHGKVIKELKAARRTPFGLPARLTGAPDDVGEEWLEPDDAVVLYTDGVTEARSTDAGEFGLERLADYLERSAASGQPSPEVLRHLVHAVLDHQSGVLQDDATVLMAQWTSSEQSGFADQA